MHQTLPCAISKTVVSLNQQKSRLPKLIIGYVRPHVTTCFVKKVLNLVSYIVIMLSSAGPTKTSDQNRAWKNMKQGKKSCAPTLIWSSSIFGRRRKKQVEPSTSTNRNMWWVEKENGKLKLTFLSSGLLIGAGFYQYFFWCQQMCNVNTNAMFGEAMPLARWRVTDIHEYLLFLLSLENYYPWTNVETFRVHIPFHTIFTI